MERKNWIRLSVFFALYALPVTLLWLDIFPYEYDVITLLVTLVMGLIWGAIYYQYPNFWGTAFSHAVLGATSIFVGLI